MEEKYNEATPKRAHDHILDAPLVEINILAFVKQLKEEPTWKSSDRNTITVFKTNGMSIVLIALRKGAEMAEHKAEGIISIQVLEGHLKFTTAFKSVELNEGAMLTLHEHISHTVLALQETTFLLTLAGISSEK